jgi:hypothetical protein
MSQAETLTSGLAVGTPEIRSVGPIAFGPDGVLFVADNASAAIFALAVAGEPGGAHAAEDIDRRLAAHLGAALEDVRIRDLAVHPDTGAVFLSVMRAGTPVLLTLDAAGEPREIPLEDIPFARIDIEDAPADDDERQDIRVVEPGEPGGDAIEHAGIKLRIKREPLRTTTVTDLAYVDGQLIVAGASNEEFLSSLRRIPFPGDGDARTSSLEIFHVSHGKYETHSPIRSFVPYAGATRILAAYTCTPVVSFSLAEMEGAKLAKGRTVAELGAMNTPLDMIAFDRDGEEHLLVSNTRHPLLKLRVADLAGQEALTTPQAPKGAPREVLAHEGVSKLAAADGSVLMLQRDGDGRLHLREYASASL